MRVVYYKLATLTDVIAQEVGDTGSGHVIVRRPLEVVDVNPAGVPGQGKQILFPWVGVAKKDVYIAKDQIISWAEVDEETTKEYQNSTRKIFDTPTEEPKELKTKQVH